MHIRMISLIAMCTALAACGSKPSEQKDAPASVAVPANELAAPPAVPAASIKPAPDGLPSRVAKEVIAASKLTCDGVTKAERNVQDGSIVANCTGGETYRVYTVEGQGPVAVKQ